MYIQILHTNDDKAKEWAQKIKSICNRYEVPIGLTGISENKDMTLKEPKVSIFKYESKTEAKKQGAILNMLHFRFVDKEEYIGTSFIVLIPPDEEVLNNRVRAFLGRKKETIRTDRREE